MVWKPMVHVSLTRQPRERDRAIQTQSCIQTNVYLWSYGQCQAKVDKVVNNKQTAAALIDNAPWASQQLWRDCGEKAFFIIFVAFLL